jgi:four helix bundle protein
LPALFDQMERAGQGMVLTIAEGAGRRTEADKKRFFTMANGSACECEAVLDLIRLRRLASPRAVDEALALLSRVEQMLVRLITRKSAGRCCNENAGNDHAHENEHENADDHDPENGPSS